MAIVGLRAVAVTESLGATGIVWYLGFAADWEESMSGLGRDVLGKLENFEGMTADDFVGIAEIWLAGWVNWWRKMANSGYTAGMYWGWSNDRHMLVVNETGKSFEAVEQPTLTRAAAVAVVEIVATRRCDYGCGHARRLGFGSGFGFGGAEFAAAAGTAGTVPYHEGSFH